MLLPLKPNEAVLKDGRKTRRGVLVLRGYNKWIKMLSTLGWIFTKVSAKGKLTFSELAELMERDLPEEAKSVLRELDLYPQHVDKKRTWNWRPLFTVFRAMQAFRVLELDVRGLALCADNVVINVIYPEKLSAPGLNSGASAGATILWSLFLEDGLAKRILLALMKTKPGEDQILVDVSGLSLSIYDRVILEELRYSVQRWNTKENTVGFPVDGREIIATLRPLNDASVLLTLACISGITIPVRSLTHVVREVNDDFPAKSSKFRKEYRNILGAWIAYTEALRYVTEMRVPKYAPKWQQTAIEMVVSRLRK